MSRDEPRSALSRAVTACRRILVGDRKKKELGDLGAQLEAPYGFDPKTGVPRPVAQMGHLRAWQKSTAEKLRDWHTHLMISASGTEVERARVAYDQMKYELGYTALHRLAALRMAEERTIVQQCVGAGQDSKGFRLYLKMAGDAGLGRPEEVYASFLARTYDELARDLPAVFDRGIAASLIAPSPSAITAVLAEINADGIATLWNDDETLGWIFEDYNDADERKEMREHDAPRNARELAVRNQFFTPRWVVEFLTDNTLGRLWFDLTGGKTALKESCRFLLKPTVIPEEGCRDPRDIKVLDPACGSGHFLLYVCDLLETIYREAWTGRHHTGTEHTPLWHEFPDEKEFLREIPRLILAHNIHGVDIDPRCIQEAGVAMWLRAHRSWAALGLKAKDRPRIAKVNLVCAQALPDSPAIRAKLREKVKPAVLGRLVDALFLRVAEMGVLLRVETAIKETVESVKKDYLTWKQDTKQRDMFGEVVGERQTTLAAFTELQGAGADEAFWADADKLVLRALEALTEDSEDKDHYKNRLFAEEMKHELEFFDMSRIKFDVILMNPPFGAPSESTKGFLDVEYPNAGHDLYAMFYERTLEMLSNGGRVGAITNRAWLALPTLGDFRQKVLWKKGTVEVAADFGYGVLKAKVETAAAVVRSGRDLDAPATWVRLVKTGRKVETLLDAVTNGGASHPAVSVVAARHFKSLPGMVCGYWMSGELTSAYSGPTTFKQIADVKQGTATADDGRFLRLLWEVSPQDVNLAKAWARYAKGGESRRYFDDVHLVVRWNLSGYEIAAFPPSCIRNAAFYGRKGVTWPRRTNLRISPRVHFSGCAFGDKGPSALVEDDSARLSLLAVLCSAPAYLLLSVRFQTADDSPNSISKSYEVGLVRDLPWPSLSEAQASSLSNVATDAVDLVRLGQVEEDDTGETVSAFALPPTLLAPAGSARSVSLEAATRARVTIREDRLTRLSAIQAEIDTIVADAYGFSDRDRQVMDEELEPPIAALPGTEPIDDAQFTAAYLTKAELDGDTLPGGKDAEMDVRVEHRRKKQVRLRDETTLSRVFQAPPTQIAAVRRRLGLLRKDDLHRAAADILSYAVGVAFGRWDIRLWAHPEWIPTFADPFDPMPACPLGQLVNAEGLPATEDRLVSEAWLGARKHPTTLPEGPTTKWETKAGAYPLEVAWSGMLFDDTLDDALTRRPPNGFLARVTAVLEHLFGKARSEWEQDMAEALGVTTPADWLRSPGAFFDDHLSRYSKSRRKAPIYWPLSTPSGGLTIWLYAPRFDKAMLPFLVNHLRVDVEVRRDERDALQKRVGSDAAKLARLTLLDTEIAERSALRAQIEDVLKWGYAPHADDGFVITLGPLHFAFRLAKWRDALKTTWVELVHGDYDWAHLAMLYREDEVLEACKKDRSIAIAHGREDLYVAPLDGKKRAAKAPAAAAKKAPARAAEQTNIPGVKHKKDKP